MRRTCKFSGCGTLCLFTILTLMSLLYCARFITNTFTGVIAQNYVLDNRQIKIKPSPVQIHRIEHLRNYCKFRMESKQNLNIRFVMRNRYLQKEEKAHIFIGRKTDVIYCAVPKVASTNWKRMLILFDGLKSYLSEMSVKSKVHTLPELKPLYDMRVADMRKAIKTSYKFLFVRHPFERLVSAYRNKFADNNTYFEKTYGSRILRMSRKHLTRDQYTQGKGVTFKEFVQWVVRKHLEDPHWLPVMDLCNPCQIKYDFVGKMETLKNDADEVVKNIDPTLSFPYNWTDGYKVSSNELMSKYFLELNESEISEIFNYYKEDFTAFDYELPKISKHTDNSNEFLRALKKVMKQQ